MNAFTLVQKLWNCCNVQRDVCMLYGDYIKPSSGQLSLEQFRLIAADLNGAVDA